MSISLTSHRRPNVLALALSLAAVTGLLAGPAASATPGSGSVCTIDRLPVSWRRPYLRVRAIDPTERWVVAGAGATRQGVLLWDDHTLRVHRHVRLSWAEVYDVSETGIVVGAGDVRPIGARMRGFAILPDGTLVHLDHGGHRRHGQAWPMGIASDESIYGLADTKRGYGIARWSLDTPDRPRLIAAEPAGYRITKVFVSPDGSLAATGESVSPPAKYAAWWWDDDGVIHQLIAPDGRADHVTLAAFSGRYAVGIGGERYSDAVRWDLATGTSMWLPNDPSYASYAINDQGQVAGEAVDTAHAVLVDDKSVTLLPEIEGTRTGSMATGISDDGTLAGTADDSTPPFHGPVPVLWHRS